MIYAVVVLAAAMVLFALKLTKIAVIVMCAAAVLMFGIKAMRK
ncbi:MAG TPA: hypothetical protein VK445_11615 [Dissulfurispiraceae bacterium]|nr:hypothetical protein [Dissulfurispiraceae bacterium]